MGQNRKDKTQAKVVKKEEGYHMIGQTTKKVLKNQDAGIVDFKDDLDREGGATRTNRSGK